MTPLEEELKKVFRKEEPPEDFLRKVMAQMEQEALQQKPFWTRWRSYFLAPSLRWVAVPAMLLLLAGGVWLKIREAQLERAEGELAKHQVMLALQIASNKLNHAQMLVRQKALVFTSAEDQKR
jgi:hypothetical protein